MENDDLTEKERKMFDELSRAAVPPASLEDKIVHRLKSAGEIGTRRKQFSFLRLAAGLAASIVIFAAGWFVRDNSSEGAYNYVLLLHQSESFARGDSRARVREYTDWARAVAESGAGITGERLGESLIVSASGITEPGDQSVSGFFMLKATREQAIAIAGGSPHIKYGGSIEVRKIE